MNDNRIFIDLFSQVFILSIIFLSTTLLAVDKICAQVPVEHQEEIEVMILGTTHFGNPGQDVINIKFPDVLQPKYQSQVDSVIENLAEFQPTKIALEARPDYKAKVDSMYNNYITGEHSLSRNERQQLGFKLAGKMNHDQVYSIDHDGEFPFQAVLDFAKEHQPEFVEQFEKLSKYVEKRNQELVSNNSIPEILRKKNSPEYLEVQRHFYAETASVGNDTTFVGADLVSKWHERNIKIFSSLSRIAEPGDRIIVIFGSGHAPLLRYFVESDLQMKLVEPSDYL
ncbi:MAG: hypothetical protein GVY07_08965 [Bacteroidetes bacterium]|jgi:hypothetical protein|nr:hypothetical protein [Bacteroidota bacterium]